MTQVDIGGIAVANHLPLTLFAGLNVLESCDLALQVAEKAAQCARAEGLGLVFKGSFDKANRSSVDSPRGPGLQEGLRILEKVKCEQGLPTMTDLHEPGQAGALSEVVDCLQIPAFLCRQTDLIAAAAATGLPLNIKKAQFLSPQEMGNVVEKCRRFGNRNVMVCERGSSFGYQRLVVDMSGFDELKRLECPTLFDVTHSVQRPGALGFAADGRRAALPALMRSALVQGLAGLFVETHPRPDQAWCDGPCALPLDMLPAFVAQARRVDEFAKSMEPLHMREHSGGARNASHGHAPSMSASVSAGAGQA